MCLTADARVDNREELVRILTVKGFVIEREPTDADLILAAYECWGEGCPAYILGDFAFAVWDPERSSFFCARDTLGVRPLHYSKVGNTLCVASDAEQVLQHPEVPCRIDELAVADALFWNWKDEHRSMFRDVHRLPPGHRLVANATRIRVEPYWEIDRAVRTVYQRDEDYAEHFLELFSRSVADRLRSQNPEVAILLSGGLDSTSVAGVAQRMCQSRGGPALTGYSFVFNRIRECDEREYTRMVAQALGLDVEYIDAERLGLFDFSPGLGASIESPPVGYQPLLRHVLIRAREQGARVMLTGMAGFYSFLEDGSFADVYRLLHGQFGVFGEIAGYAREIKRPFYRALYALLLCNLVPDIVDRILMRVSGRRTSSSVPEWILPEFAQRTGLEGRLANPPKWRNLIRLLARRKGPTRIRDVPLGVAISATDRFVSSFGMETRHPFLDRRVLEFLVSIPPEQVYKGGRKRLVIRRAMKGILPEAVRLKWAKGSQQPFAHYVFREKAAAAIKDLFEDPFLSKIGVVADDKLMHAFDAYVAGESSEEFGGVISLKLWLREYESFCGEAPTQGKDR